MTPLPSVGHGSASNGVSGAVDARVRSGKRRGASTSHRDLTTSGASAAGAGAAAVRSPYLTQSRSSDRLVSGVQGAGSGGGGDLSHSRSAVAGIGAGGGGGGGSEVAWHASGGGFGVTTTLAPGALGSGGASGSDSRAHSRLGGARHPSGRPSPGGTAATKSSPLSSAPSPMPSHGLRREGSSSDIGGGGGGGGGGIASHSGGGGGDGYGMVGRLRRRSKESADADAAGGADISGGGSVDESMLRTMSISTPGGDGGADFGGVGVGGVGDGGVDFVQMDVVPVTVGARSGLTAGPNDVTETVMPVRETKDAKLRLFADATPNVYAVASITWRGHNPTMFKINQDRMIVAFDTATRSLLLCVFDGHGQNGHKVSGWFHQYYAKKLFSDRRFATHPVEAMADSLIVLEDLLVRESGVDTQLSGSTAAIALLRGDMVHAINVGDSRVVAGVSSKGGRVQPQQLTVDHKPDVPAERARIVAVGGRVLATRNKMNPSIVGPLRVWLKDVPAPGLAMSRALGDLVAKTAGVISTPYKVSKSLSPQHRVLVLASDGLWDFVPNEEVVAIASQACDARTAAHTLVRTARTRWLERTACSDDITIIVVTLVSPSS